MYPLRLAARQRARLPLDCQVSEADFDQVADAIAQLAHHDRCTRSDLRNRSDLVEPIHQLANRELANVGDRFSIDPHVERFGFELRTRANRTSNEAPIL